MNAIAKKIALSHTHTHSFEKQILHFFFVINLNDFFIKFNTQNRNPNQFISIKLKCKDQLNASESVTVKFDFEIFTKIFQIL